MLRICYVAILTLFIVVAPFEARAWGGDGHRMIAQLAYDRLTPEARAELDRLIATDAADPSPGCAMTSIESASTWSDCVRGLRAYANQSRWHFDNIPVCESAPRFECANGDCATAAITRAERTLRDRRASDQARLRALARLIHFIGDIHQPLHASDNGDRGGNDVRVTYLGAASYQTQDGASRPNNLHGVWDTPLFLASLGSDPAAGRADIQGQIRDFAGAWAQDDAVAWAQEANAIAVNFIYARWPEPLQCGVPSTAPVVIDADYVAAAGPIIREQIAKAAVRLAMTLNRVLAPS